MLSIQNLSLQYGKKHLFRNISAQVHDGDRIGLAGVNGSGKSSLLKIMCREQDVDPGIVSKASWFSVAYLPQEVTTNLGNVSLFEEAESAFSEVLVLQKELEDIGLELAGLSSEDPAMESLLNRQGELQHHLDGVDVFRIRPRVEQVLLGLGFSNQDFEKDVTSFSGGWIMRLLLAKLLLKKPSLLLLDEPTNHLDLDSLTWLENFLGQYKGALIVISHDRTFLDRITSLTWELSIGKLSVYKGNYSHYLVEKEQRLELERAAWANQQAKIKQTERFIERFRSKSSKAKQVQSRVKQLEKMERIEISQTDKAIRFSFPPATSSGRDMLSLKSVRKKYGDQSIFKDLSFSLQRGDKLAIVGVNGAGKTTLLKVIAGQEQAQGDVGLGHNVLMSYFGQHQAQEMAGDVSVLDTVYHAAREMTVTKVRSLLGAFLFSGDDVEKNIGVLSGGEKSRVALARMLVRPANLLLLDEPTNHLDMSSQEVLQDAMGQYEGAIIVVSHNRFFVNSFVNKVLEIRNGKATLYEGNIADYQESREAEELRQKNISNPPGEQIVDVQEELSSQDKKSQRKERAKRRQELGGKLKPWKKVVQKAEEQIGQLESRKEELEKEMADPDLYGEQKRWAELSKEYGLVERRLERQYQKWEEAQEQIESMEKL